MDSINIYLIPFAGVLALAFTYNRAQWVAQQDPGTDRMKRIAGYITDGAMAFLRAEYSLSKLTAPESCTQRWQ